VVNIDNGFGAGFQSALIARAAHRAAAGEPVSSQEKRRAK
jgi:hypothetical protein